MAYDPAAGHAVSLALGGEYAPAPGHAVPLALGAVDEPPPPAPKPGIYLVLGAGWGLALAGRRAEPGARWTDPPRRAPEPAVGWDEPRELRAEPGGSWRDPPKQRVERTAPWEDTSAPLGRELEGPWRDPPKQRVERAAPWEEASGHPRREYAAAHHDPPRRRDERRLPWGAHAPVPREWGVWYRYPTRRRPEWRIPWNQSRLVRWEERWWKEGSHPLSWRVAGAPEPVWHPPGGGALLLPLQCRLLDWPGYAVWLFLRARPCPPNARQRVWRLVSSFSVVRLPDRTPVPVLGASLGSDLDSWAWDVRLVLPDRDALELVSPLSGVGGAPVEIEATVNGYVWTALVEGFEERREFGKSGFTVTGRSRSAYLAAPYALPRSHEEAEARTAVQLAEAELTPHGWALDWDVGTDWLVPAGAWAYAGKTPLEAVGLVAGAVGARLQTDPAGDVLRVLPRYPVSPWDWAEADPDVGVNESLVGTLALRWMERPAWQGVYAAGVTQGVLVHVKRVGSDGTPSHPLVTDPLLTHVDAGRERGRQVLAAGGRWAVVTVEMPILPSPQEPGLLTPGQLVEVADGVATWRGLVTSVRVTAGRPKVRQTVEIERYYPAVSPP